MQRKIQTLFLLGLLFTSWQAFASVPGVIGMPFVPKDATNTPLPDGAYTVVLRITTAAGDVQYEEEQSVDISESVANIALGEGYRVGGAASELTGGVPATLFSSNSGPFYISAEFQGEAPQTLAEVGSVPYAMVAGYAERLVAGAIDAEALGEAIIAEAHLSEQLHNAIYTDPIDLTRLPGMATEAYVDAQFVEKGIVKASQVDTTGLGLTWGTGDDLRVLLQSLDAGMTTINGVNLVAETDARTQKDTELETAIAATTAAIASEASTRASKDSEHDSAIATNTAAIASESSTRATKDTAHDSAISSLQSELPNYLDKRTGGTVVGTVGVQGAIAMQGNVGLRDGDTVDGVDVSELSSQVQDHETRIVELEGPDTGESLLPGSTAYAYGSVVSGSLSNTMESGMIVSRSGASGGCNADGSINEGSRTYTVTFANARSNANYVVELGGTTPTKTPYVSAKSATGFSVKVYQITGCSVGLTFTSTGMVTTDGNFDFAVFAKD